MITWSLFLPFALVATLLWAMGAIAAIYQKRGKTSRVCQWMMGAGIGVYLLFIIGLWVGLGRPPMRTLGETRLWYSLFMMVSGWMVYAGWRIRWIPFSSLLMALVFIIINIAKPDLHDQSLMPALQSVWFIPHVTAYMFAYSIFGCAFLLATAGLWRQSGKYLRTTDSLARIGMIFLSFGMLSGCIWAKQAWGNYWSWDPKETWAAATWCVYLAYIHQRLFKRDLFVYWWLIAGFVLLQMCWYGVNLLPSAANSLHSY